MTVVFASLNIGLNRSQACGKYATRRFTAIARGVQQAFERANVDAMGLVEVGDAAEGLPSREATQLLEIIQAQMPQMQLVVHANATGHPYILLSKAGSRANLTDVRVVEGFLCQKYRKALRATFTGADGDVDLWLVHLASSSKRHLTMNVRRQMLSKLTTERPTVIAGDINTAEFVLRHWMQNAGAAFSPSLASSGATPPLHGDFTIATNVFMWQMEHQVGKSFEDARAPGVDRVSDAHDMVCVVLSVLVSHGKAVTNDAAELGGRPGEEASSSEDSIAADAAELGGATDPVARSEEKASSSQDPTTADAAELGGATDPVGDLRLDSDESSRLRDEAVRAVSQTQQTLLQAEEDSVVWPSSSEEDRDRTRSPSRWRPSPRTGSYSPSPDRSRVLVDGHELPLDFLAAMQELLWPAKFQERDRPADLLSFDSSLSPTVRMAPLDATVSVAALILALRQVALDRRLAEAQVSSTFPVVPNPDAPLTHAEIGWVLDFWKGKFHEQTITQEQADRDSRSGYTKAEMRKRMRGRWYTYMSRALGNRKLGMALITMGFNVDLHKLATAYAQATAAGDASSLPSSDLRRRALAMRSWYRWGRQLYNSVESKQVAWEELGPCAINAWRWYYRGWSAEEADRLTKEYGHGMLRTGPERGSFLGQQATGSVVDRMRPALL